IDAVLGQGGFGITYLATQVALNRKVAIKEFFMKEFCERNADTSHVTLGTSGSREIVERFRAKFIKEAQHIAQLNHPHIVRIHDVFETNGTAYYVMEYHDGGSLADRVKQGPLPEAAAVDFVHQVAEALGYLHSRKMNHLDVKPGNILLDEEQRAVLIDFGLSKRYDEAGHQTSTTPVGISHGYAPMEQYRPGGVGTFSPATDIYSLGATLYRLTTGQTPPDAGEVDEQGLPALPATLSAATRTAIVQAMQPRRKDRPQSIEAFCALLDGKEVAAETVLDIAVDEETHLDDTPKSTPKPTPKPAPQPAPQPAPVPAPPKKRGGKKWLWTVVILLLVAAGFWGGRTAMTHLRKQQAIADSIALAETERAAFVQDSTEKANAAAEKAEQERREREAAEKAERERLAREAANKTYKVGDYYNNGTKEGVVFYVDASGKHGKIVSMTQSSKALQWSSNDSEQKQLIGASSETDGAANMRAVRQRPNWRTDYPAFAWCARLGSGWYLPAIEELKLFTLNDSVHDAVNRTLAAKGGTKLYNKGDAKRYWSSTEDDDQTPTGTFCAWAVHMFDGYASNDTKRIDYYVRAVSAF
ncbi:MAG: protein kinase, partial [Alistipes sp.]|nr:protein kinase [Alistipes sp.]